MTDVDLSSLRIDPASNPVRRPRGPRVIALAVVAIAIAVALSFAWPLLRPAREVPTAAVRALDPGGPTTTAVVAEAVGWVEADPFPVTVRPLVAGRIERLEVLEGAVVTADETVIATLASAELQAARERAAAALAEREADLAAAAAALDRALALRAQNAEARIELAAARTRAAAAAGQSAAADGRRDRLAAEVRGEDAALAAQERLAAAGASNEVALARARAAADAARAAADAAVAEADSARAGHEAAAAALQLAAELAAEPVTLDQAVLTARAELDRARAARDAAAVELAIAEREWQWAAEVKSPVDGVVLRLLAAPGEHAGPEGDGIVELYDRGRLRARIDVLLDSVGAIRAGQEVELRSEVTGDTVVRGVVQRLQHESDLLKNSLQVKVGLLDPPDLWRPETLCRARFLGDEPAREVAVEQSFLVPRSAVRAGTVHVLDPARGRARAVAVRVVGERDDLAVVRGELSVTQRVILAEVADDEPVRARQEPR